MNFIKTVAVLFSTVSAVRIKNTSYDKSKARVHICINYKVENCLSAYFFGLNCYHPKSRDLILIFYMVRARFKHQSSA
jgi:hypothetical protein